LIDWYFIEATTSRFVPRSRIQPRKGLIWETIQDPQKKNPTFSQSGNAWKTHRFVTQNQAVFLRYIIEFMFFVKWYKSRIEEALAKRVRMDNQQVMRQIFSHVFLFSKNVEIFLMWQFVHA
jgi:hypothetical protein